MGVGIGVSISSSETTELGNGTVRTQYMREIYGQYTVGWCYDLLPNKGGRSLSFNLLKKTGEEATGWRIWPIS